MRSEGKNNGERWRSYSASVKSLADKIVCSAKLVIHIHLGWMTFIVSCIWPWKMWDNPAYLKIKWHPIFFCGTLADATDFPIYICGVADFYQDIYRTTRRYTGLRQVHLVNRACCNIDDEVTAWMTAFKLTVGIDPQSPCPSLSYDFEDVRSLPTWYLQLELGYEKR